MTGDADYLLRVVVPDVAAYERFLRDSLTRVEGVSGIIGDQVELRAQAGEVLDGATDCPRTRAAGDDRDAGHGRSRPSARVRKRRR